MGWAESKKKDESILASYRLQVSEGSNNDLQYDAPIVNIYDGLNQVVYQVQQDQDVIVKVLNQNLCIHPATLGIHPLLYLAGGQETEKKGFSKKFYELEVLSEIRIKKLESMPFGDWTGRLHKCGSSLLYIGGMVKKFGTVFLYSIEDDEWCEKKFDLGVKLENYTTFVINNWLHILGGTTSAGEANLRCYCWNIQTEKMRPIQAMLNYQITNMVAWLMDGPTVYLFGGRYGEKRIQNRNVFMFDQNSKLERVGRLSENQNMQWDVRVIGKARRHIVYHSENHVYFYDIMTNNWMITEIPEIRREESKQEIDIPVPTSANTSSYISDSEAEEGPVLPISIYDRSTKPSEVIPSAYGQYPGFANGLQSPPILTVQYPSDAESICPESSTEQEESPINFETTSSA